MTGGRLLIVLPPPVSTPTGGYKVQFQYANALNRAGWHVDVGFLRHADDVPRREIVLARLDQIRTSTSPGWFTLDPAIGVGFLDRRALRSADVVLATSRATIKAVAPRRPDAYAMVYDYEFWVTAGEDVRRDFEAAFRLLDGRLLVTSTVVGTMLQSIGCTAAGYVGTGIDLEVFRCLEGDARDDRLVAFPFREGAEKGLVDAVAALALVRERRPDAGVVAFGPSYGRRILPDWIDYLSDPSDRELVGMWNRAAVAMVASRAEGFGLPGLEAMACGAALATTDAGGNLDYATDGATALVVPPMRPGRLADAVCRLLDDAELRERIAADGRASAGAHSVEECARRLCAIVAG